MVNRSVKVSVGGHTLAVKTAAPSAYIQELAEFVDAKIEEVKRSGRTVTTQALALLAALNIADELYQLRESQKQLKRQVREKSERILRFLDEEAELSMHAGHLDQDDDSPVLPEPQNDTTNNDIDPLGTSG